MLQLWPSSQGPLARQVVAKRVWPHFLSNFDLALLARCLFWHLVHFSVQ